MTLTIVLISLLAMMVVGVPIALALLLSGMGGLLAVYGLSAIGPFLADVVYEAGSDYVLLTIPMFILMSEFLAVGGLTQDIIRSSDRWLGRLSGGLGLACVAASTLMAAVVGSSTASAASMSRAAYPGMKSLGYSDALSTGIIAIAGTLAIMVPPSIVLVVYGIIVEESVGKLLIAGVIPGLLTALSYCAVIVIWAKRSPASAPRGAPFNFLLAVKGSLTVWPVLLLIVIVMGALYSGMATATEVAALGAFAAILILLALRRINATQIQTAIASTISTTGMIIAIILSAHIFGNYLAVTQFTNSLVEAAINSGMSRWVTLFLIIGIYLILGMFLDQLAILVLTLPVVFPLITSLGFDGIWFGIVVTKTVEIGLVSPPLGLNVFITASGTGVPVKTVFNGIMPFLAMELLILALIIFVPEISLGLIGTMK